MYKSIAILSLFPLLLLSGCEKLLWLDEQVGKMFFDASSSSFLSVEEKKDQEEPEETDLGNLSKEIKQNIDEWLKSEGLNRYGDPDGTYYTGGTPLFDEATGKAIERYEYILGKIPGILEKIK